MGSILSDLNQFAYYICVGLAFVIPYGAKTLAQGGKDIEHKVVTAAVIGYFYCFVAFNIPVSINYFADRIIIVISAALLGYLAANVIMSKRWEKVLQFLKIERTAHATAWSEILSHGCDNHIAVTSKGKIFEGIIFSYEDGTNAPWVALRNFVIRDEKTREILENKLESDSEIVYINVDSCDNVRLYYYDDASKEQLKNYSAYLKSKDADSPAEYSLLLEGESLPTEPEKTAETDKF